MWAAVLPQAGVSFPWPPPPLPPVSDELRARLEALEAQRNSQLQVEAILERQVDQLRLDLGQADTARTRCTALEGQLEQTRALLDGLQASRDESSSRLQEVQRHLATALGERDQYREEIRTLEDRVVAEQRKAREVQAKSHAQQLSLEVASEGAEAHSRRIETELHRLQATVKSLQEQAVTDAKQVQDANNQCRREQSEKAELQRTLADEANRCRILEAKLSSQADLQRALDDEANRCRMLEAKLSSAQAELHRNVADETLANRCRVLEAKLSSAEVELQHVVAEEANRRKGLEAKISSAEAELHRALAQEAELQHALTDEANRCRALEAKVSSSEGELQGSLRRFRELEAVNARLESDKEQLMQSLSTEKATRSSLFDEMRILKAKFDDAQLRQRPSASTGFGTLEIQPAIPTPLAQIRQRPSAPSGFGTMEIQPATPTSVANLRASTPKFSSYDATRSFTATTSLFPEPIVGTAPPQYRRAATMPTVGRMSIVADLTGTGMSPNKDDLEIDMDLTSDRKPETNMAPAPALTQQSLAAARAQAPVVPAPAASKPPALDTE